MDTHAVEGITLTSFAFQETSHIISLLTKEHGRIKCVTKSYRKTQVRSISPLLGVELLVIPSEKELWKCKEYIVRTSYPHLRTSLKHLRIAAEITNFLDKFLPLHHQVLHLYTLYSDFLAHLPHFIHPHVAATCFLEKLMVHEGMLKEASMKGSFSEYYQKNSDIGYYHKLGRQVGIFHH